MAGFIRSLGREYLSSSRRTLDRARWRSTRWLVSLISRALQTSSALPALDVAQQDHGALHLAAARRSPRATNASVSATAVAPRASSPSAAAARPSVGPAAVAGRNDPARRRPSPPRPRRRRATRTARVRRSRSPRVLARLTRIRKIQVFSDERPSKRSRPLSTAEPGLLHHLLGDRAARDVTAGQPQHRRVIAAGQLDERRLLSVAKPPDQLRPLRRAPAVVPPSVL